MREPPDPTQSLSELRSRLNRPEIVRAVVAVVHAQTERWAIDKGTPVEHRSETSEWWIGVQHLLRRWRITVSDSLRDSVISLLPAPSLITERDLFDAIVEHLPLDGGDRYLQVINSLLSRLAWRSPGYTVTDRMRTITVDIVGKLVIDIPRDEFLAVLPSGLGVMSEGATLADTECTRLHLSVLGVCSESALERAAAEVERLMDAVLPYFLRQDPNDRSRLVAQSEAEAEQEPDPDEKVVLLLSGLDGYRLDVAENQRRALSLACRCVQIYFEQPSKKETLTGRRIRNALQLLCEAERQANDAVELALRFAAIEAMLCTKNEGGIVDELAGNASTLLFPNSDDRRAAMKRIKQLYDLRSRVLHGVGVNVETDANWIAKDLSMAVLRGVLEWLECFERTAGAADSAHAQFFDQLSDARISGKRIVGVSDCLWKSVK